MSWFKEVSKYIDDNLEDFIMHFFPNSSASNLKDAIRLNPAPCCGHNDSFAFATNMNAGNCFSCGTKGNRIAIVEEVWGTEMGRDELEKWSGIKQSKVQSNPSEEQSVEKERERRLNEIYGLAVAFYHMQLFSDEPEADKALKKQLGSNLKERERGHFEQTLREFKVGLSLDNFDSFMKLMRKKGYTEEELEEAKKLIWVPPFYYVYPYFDVKGNLVRINTKPFKRRCLGTKQLGGGYAYNCLHETYDVSKKAKKAHEEETGHVMSADVYSTGDKTNAFFFSPEQKGKRKYAILVEGEDDVLSTHEEMLLENPRFGMEYKVIGTGGNGIEGIFSSPFLRQFEKLYEAFDHDAAGDKYREQLNKEAADMPVYSLMFDRDFNDIDAYVKAPVESHTIQDLLENAKIMESKHIMIEREGLKRHIWHAKNRKFQLTFEVESFNKNSSQLTGSMVTKINGVVTDKKAGGIDKIKLDATINPAKLELSEHLERYYNDLPEEKGVPVRGIRELADIVHFSKNYQGVIKQIAWHLHKASGKSYERNFRTIEKTIGDQRIVAEILREVNGFTNAEIDPHALIPKINLSQYFNVTNNDAYFYFSRIIKDGEATKLVPFLLSNRKEELRLDLLKRKDPQCLLLIQNKYEMPFEVEAAVMDTAEVSLQPYWVDRWKNGETTKEELDPKNLIGEIEEFIKRCYYLEETTRKVLALWIYCTYYYMLFKSGFPYLMFTGPKGTGKSTLDTLVYLLSLNSKIALDFSPAALYRTITFEGGTFILDEVEHLSDKKSADTSDYAKILKGGYSDNAYVYRTNMDKGGVTEKYSVFGPKVISNINGIDDVIADRCIFVRTFRTPEEKLRGLHDVQLYKEELRGDVHSVTSRCVLSALENFNEVSQLFNSIDSLFETGNARLTQILKPLVTVARFVGGDYEKHLMEYYEKEVKQSKAEVSEGTTEGMVRSILKRVSEELLGMEKDIWATEPTQHLYNTRIGWSATTRVFEIDNLHIKILCEEMNNGEVMDMKTVNQTLKAILGPGFDSKKSRRQTTATISDENLQRAMGGKRTVRVYRYFLNAEDFVDTTKYNAHREANEEQTLF